MLTVIYIWICTLLNALIASLIGAKIRVPKLIDNLDSTRFLIFADLQYINSQNLPGLNDLNNAFKRINKFNAYT